MALGRHEMIVSEQVGAQLPKIHARQPLRAYSNAWGKPSCCCLPENQVPGMRGQFPINEHKTSLAPQDVVDAHVPDRQNKICIEGS